MTRQEALAKLRLMLVAGRGEAAPRPLADVAAASFEGGATAFQLREKNMLGRELLAEALELRDVCRRHGALFTVDDRLDIALAADADGLHLGQDDLPAAAARALWPRPKLLGLSVGTVAQAEAALAAGADYLGVGAVFPTGSKSDAREIPHETFKAIAALGAPVVAIGGVTAANAPGVLALGATGLAVISAITNAKDPREAAAALDNAFPVLNFKGC